MDNKNKFVKINGCYISLYRYYRNQPILLHRRVVEPAFIQLWYKLSELEFDIDLYNELCDDNKDYLSFIFNTVYPQLENKYLEIETAKKSRKLQERLVLIEGLIGAGNISIELIKELNEILDKLVAGNQIPAKQASRMKARVKRSYDAMKASINS